MFFKKSLLSLALTFATVTTLLALPKTVAPERSIIFPSGNYGWKSLAVHSGYLYVYSACDSASTVNIYAVENGCLRYVKSLKREGRLTGQPAFIGDTGYFCNGYNLAVCDLTTPEHAEVVNSVAFGYPAKTACNVYAAGEMLVLDGSDGIRLYDASDPFAPVLVDFLPDHTVKAVSEQHCLIRETDTVCRIYGITKTGFEKLGAVSIANDSTCNFVYGKTIYEANNNITRIHDISDPFKETTYIITNACLRPVLSGIRWKKLYSANGCDLEEWDVSSPLKPKLLKTIAFPIGIHEGLCIYGGQYFFLDQTRKSITAFSANSGKAVKDFESFYAPYVSEIIPGKDSVQLSYKTKISFGELSLSLVPKDNSVYTTLTDAFTDFSSAKITKFTSPTDLQTAKRTPASKIQFGEFIFKKDAEGQIEAANTNSQSSIALFSANGTESFAPYSCFAITNGNLYAVSDSKLDIYQIASITNAMVSRTQSVNSAANRKFLKITSSEMLKNSAQNQEQDKQPDATDTTESPRGAIAVSGDFAFLSWAMETADDNEFTGIVSVDISKPNELRIVDALPLPSTPCSIVIDPSTNIFYTADTLGITAVAFNTNGLMRIITDLPVSDSELKGPQQLAFLSNGTLVAACGKEGLLTAEISNTTNISIVAVFESTGFARAITVDSNTVFVCDSTRGITQFQCDMPEDAIKYRTRPMKRGAVTSAFCLDGQIFATSTETELTSLSADSKLRIISEYRQTSYEPRGFGTWPVTAVPFSSADKKHKYAAIALGEGGIDICDITSAKEIIHMSHLASETFETGNNFFSTLHVSGTKLYAVDRNNGLFIIDVADPANPTLVSELIIR